MTQAIHTACRLLRDAAQELAEGISVRGVPDWKGEPDTAAAYDETMAAIAALEAHQVEHMALQQGYDAARLEIESLQAQLKAMRAQVALPVNERTDPRALLQAVEDALDKADALIRTDDGHWLSLPERIADLAAKARQAAPAAVAVPSNAEPLHITHGPLMRHAAALLRSRKPALPEHESVAAELERAVDGHPTPSGEPSPEWLEVARIAAAPQPPVTAPAAVAAPIGWKMVPVEPTDEMVKAADDGDREYTRRNFGGIQTVLQGPYDHWCAMISAAPQPPVAGQEPVEVHDPQCPALTGDTCTCDRHEPAVDKAWALFCAKVGDGPGAPYPGMISAFERYYSQSFADRDWRTEASVWAAAWKSALLNNPAPQPAPAAQGDEDVLSMSKALFVQREAEALDAARYRLLRRGQHWSVIDGIGDTLRAEALDSAIDAARAQAKKGGAA